MAWSAILDVSIVLIFVYMVMAVIGSAVVELVGGILGWRAKTLRSSMAQLLDDPHMKSLAARVYAHPLVAPQSSGGGGPSYVDPKLFALALADVVQGAGGFQGATQVPSVAALVRASGHDPDAFRATAEAWFDGAMTRLSGVYKRWTHVALLVFSFTVAVLCNIDTIQLTRLVAAMDPAKLASLIDTIGKCVGEVPVADGSVGRGMVPCKPPVFAEGSTSADMAKALSGGFDALDNVTNLIPFKERPATIAGWLGKLVGWLITAVAASLGSHFWFNLLQNALRLSGRKPGG